MCDDISDNFDVSDNCVHESDEFPPEDIMFDDGITTRTQLIKLQR